MIAAITPIATPPSSSVMNVINRMDPTIVYPPEYRTDDLETRYLAVPFN